MRTFIAIELPKNIISSIRKVQENLKNFGFKTFGKKIRWVRPENIHLTLKFSGDIKINDFEKIKIAISDAVDGYNPISLMGKGMGIFPSIKRPRILWVGIGGQTNQLFSLKKNLEEKLESAGFPKENKPFKGHLTLGRINGKINPQNIADAINEFQGFETKAFTCDKIFLFQSELKTTGPIYKKLIKITI